MSKNSSKPQSAVPKPPQQVTARRAFMPQLTAIAGYSVWLVVAFVVCAMIVQAVLQIGLAEQTILSSTTRNLIMVGQGALLYALIVAVIIGVPWVVRRSRTTLRQLGLNRLPEWRDFAYAIAGLVLYFIGAFIVLEVAQRVAPGFNVNQVQDLGLSKPTFGWEKMSLFVLLVVVAPVAEELVFRGYLFGKLRSVRVPFWLAALVTSVLFGIAHLQWNVGLNVFVLSLAMCATRELTGSLWASLMMHMAKNGLAFYLLVATGIL